MIVALWGVLAVLGAPLAYAASPAHDLGVVARPMGGVLAGTSALGAVPPAVLVSDQKVTVDPEPDGTAVALDPFALDSASLARAIETAASALAKEAALVYSSAEPAKVRFG